MIGFAIGNGLSRKGFDLETLRGKGPIIGCNYIYRDFSPDYLVAIDSDPLKKIQKLKDREFILISTDLTRSNICVDGKQTMGIMEVNGWWGKNSGIIACSFLSKIIRCDQVYMIGFDFFRIGEGDTVNDLYNGKLCKYHNFDGAWNKLWADCPWTEFIRVGHVPDYDYDFFYKKLKGVTLIDKLPELK